MPRCISPCGGKYFHVLGIARHRAMHRDNREDCIIEYTNGDAYEYTFSNRPVK